MNILILSAGTRNKIIQYFKKELSDSGKIIATDMSDLAPAIYQADKYYIVPKISSPEYIDSIIDICKKENINGVLSLIDSELSLIAENVDKFNSIGTMVIGSNYDLCLRSMNKLEMFKWLASNGYNCAKTFDSIETFTQAFYNGDINFPVIIKPICGSASKSVCKIDNLKEINIFYERERNLIIQEFLDGDEIGADVYIDMISGEIISIFTKKKLRMRSGETDKSISFKDKKLFNLIEKFVNESGFRGQIDIDIFDVNGEYYISEVNPRFGGGYPHAYEVGCNHILYIINNIKGIINTPSIGEYEDGIYMMKYNEVMIKR